MLIFHPKYPDPSKVPILRTWTPAIPQRSRKMIPKRLHWKGCCKVGRILDQDGGVLLMVQKSGKLTSWGKGSLSHYLQGFLHARWLTGFLPPTVFFGDWFEADNLFESTSLRGVDEDSPLSWPWPLLSHSSFCNSCFCIGNTPKGIIWIR